MFSSEVRSILAAGLLERPRLDRRAVRSILWNGFVVGPVDRRRRGRAARCRRMAHDRRPRDTVRRATYWSIPRPEDGPSIDEAELRHVVEDSVARHLIADVPVGIFLSGGIDSSAVAALAQRANTTPVHTFTLGFDEQEFNEGEIARAIARAIGTEHHEIRSDGGRLHVGARDGRRHARSADVRRLELVLHLQGGSRGGTQGGAGRHRRRRAVRRVPHLPRATTLQTWNRRTRMIPSSLRMLGRPAREPDARRLGSNRRAPQTRWAKLPEMVRAGEDLTALYQLAYALFLPDFQERLLLGRAVRRRHALRPDAGAVGTSAVGDGREVARVHRRRPRAAVVPRGAAAARHRRRQHGGVARDAPAARRQCRRRGRRAGAGRGAIRAARPQAAAASRRARPARPGSSSSARSAVSSCRSTAGSGKSLGERHGRDHARPLAGAPRSGWTDAPSTALWSAFQRGEPGLYWTRVWALYVLIRWCHRHGVLA